MKILVVKLSSMGDVLASTPVFQALRQKYPQAVIDHAVFDYCAICTDHNPSINNRCVISPIPSGNIFKDITSLSRFWFAIWKGKYDLAIILHRHWIVQTLCFLGRVKKIVGYRSTKNYFIHRSFPFKIRVNRSQQDIDLLRHCLDEDFADPKKLEFYPRDEWRFDATSIPQEYICVSLGGGNYLDSAKNRKWPVANYAALFTELNLPIVLVGKGTDDEKLADEAIKLATNRSIINLVGKLDYHDTAKVISAARLFLGNDSGLTFLSAAVGTLTLGLYGPVSPNEALPIGPRSYAIQGLSYCSPCFNAIDGRKGLIHTCGENICMAAISVKKVADKIEELLEDKN